MNSDVDAAALGLVGVGVGALVSLIGTVIVPWVRDSIDRRRDARERLDDERRQNLLLAMDALLEMRQARPGEPDRAAALTRSEAMEVLTLWARGDVATTAIISEVEARTGIEFSEDLVTVASNIA